MAMDTTLAVGPFVEPGFPFIVSTLDAGVTGGAFPARNLAVRCVVLMLDNDTHACFDTDLLRVAAAWRGGFMKLTTMAQVSYDKPFNKNNAIPQLVGTPIVATGIYPGWMGAEPAYRRSASGGPESDRRRPRTDRGGARAVERPARRREGRRALVHGRGHRHRRADRHRVGRRTGRHHAHLPHGCHRATDHARRRRSRRGRGELRRRRRRRSCSRARRAIRRPSSA